MRQDSPGLMRVQTLLITGTVAAGKSTVAAEINDALAAVKVPNAAVDLDALIWQWPSSSEWNNDLMFENLAALWPNYLSRGATHLVLARVLEDAAELDRYRIAVPGAEITVCRLVAPEADRVARLLGRMPPGPSRDWHLARTVELNKILEQLGLEDFVVDNGARPVREVAIEILLRAGWISRQQAEDAAFGAG
jgi:predicted kinase